MNYSKALKKYHKILDKTEKYYNKIINLQNQMRVTYDKKEQKQLIDRMYLLYRRHKKLTDKSKEEYYYFLEAYFLPIADELDNELALEYGKEV